MSAHINRFIDRVKALDHQKQRDVVLSVMEARDLLGDITKLLLKLQDLEAQRQPAASTQEVVEVRLEGGNF
jgi:type II secretory pathway predicted ATPase ExeA